MALNDAHSVAARNPDLAAIVHASPDAIVVIQNGRHVFANDRALRLYRARDVLELATKPALDYMGPGLQGVAAAGLHLMTEEYRRVGYVEDVLIRLDGTRCEIEAAGSPLVFDGEPAALVVIRDISARVEAQRDLVEAREAARHAEERLAALVEYSANPIFVVDEAGMVRDANPATGRLAGDRIGQRAEDVMAEVVHPDDVPAVMRRLAEASRVSGPHSPFTFRITDGVAGWLHMEMIGNNQFGNPAIRGIVINARDVTERVQHLAQIERSRRALIQACGRTAESRDPYTAGHQRRTAELGAAIASEMGLDAHTIEGIELGATIHDIGKIAIPAEILVHPGKLSAPAFELVKTHCQVGHDIVADIDVPWPIADIVLQHHERLDGSGYPQGLVGDDILIEAQIVAVADVTEAINSHRPYRASRGLEAALAVLRDGRGTRFNAAAVDACSALIEQGRFEFPADNAPSDTTPPLSRSQPPTTDDRPGPERRVLGSGRSAMAHGPLSRSAGDADRR